MDSQTPQEFILEAFADPASVRDVVKGELKLYMHTYIYIPSYIFQLPTRWSIPPRLHQAAPRSTIHLPYLPMQLPLFRKRMGAEEEEEVVAIQPSIAHDNAE